MTPPPPHQKKKKKKKKKKSSFLKVLGKSVGLCKTSKRKDQLLYISFLVSV